MQQSLDLQVSNALRPLGLAVTNLCTRSTPGDFASFQVEGIFLEPGQERIASRWLPPNASFRREETPGGWRESSWIIPVEPARFTRRAAALAGALGMECLWLCAHIAGLT